MSAVSSTANHSSSSVLPAFESRRSIYSINKTLPFSTDRLQTIINTVATTSPSTFNSQTTRNVVLTGSAHDAFWDDITNALRNMLPAEIFPATEAKLNGFKAGYGTVLFFVDPTGVKALQQKLPTYAALFPEWAVEADAMQQFALWTALEAEGAGASLQHYGNLVEKDVKAKYGLPEDWSLKAQLVFGGKTGEPAEKVSKPVEELVSWHQ